MCAYRKQTNTLTLCHTPVALPDRYVLAQFGNQSQRGIQLMIFIVGHVGHNHDHEPTRASRVHTSHYPILCKGKPDAGLERLSESPSANNRKRLKDSS